MRDKSEENWRVGNKCLEDGDLNVAASRIYYATFQAVLYWARKKKNFTETTGVHSAIYRLMRGTKGKNVYTETLNELQTLREKADYNPETPDKNEIVELLTVGQKIRDHHLNKAEQP